MLVWIFFLPFVFVAALYLLGGLLWTIVGFGALVVYVIYRFTKAIHPPPQTPASRMADKMKIPNDLRPWMKRVKPEQRRLFR